MDPENIMTSSLTFLVAQTVKNLPEMQETWVLPLGQEDPLAKLPIFLPGDFYRQRSLVSYSPWGLRELDVTEVT